MNLKTFSTQPDFVAATVAVIENLCETKQGSIFVALSGGSTPRPVYEALAKNLQIDFERIEWYVVDERYVPFGSDDSNYKMIMEAFGAAQPEFSEHFHFFNTSLQLEESARQYEEELKKIPGTQFDLVLLGMGNDGHTASLFPHSPALQENERLAVDTINEDRPGAPAGQSLWAAPAVRDRLTITWPMILRAKKVVLLVSGEGKHSMVEELMNGTKSAEEFPARRLWEHPDCSIQYLEKLG